MSIMLILTNEKTVLVLLTNQSIYLGDGSRLWNAELPHDLRVLTNERQLLRHIEANERPVLPA